MVVVILEVFDSTRLFPLAAPIKPTQTHTGQVWGWFRTRGKESKQTHALCHSNSQLQTKLLRGRKYLPSQGSLFSRTCSLRLLVKSSLNAPNEKPFGLSKLKPHMDHFTEKLWETFPESAKEFPWKKAEELVFQRLLFLGKKASKWFLSILLIISSLSDIVLSISRDRELLIPLGLFIGCVMADFLKETSKDLFQVTEVGDMLGHLVGIGSFFVLLKYISFYMTVGGRLFLSHVCNGGLMQVLWLGKKLKGVKDSESD